MKTENALPKLELARYEVDTGLSLRGLMKGLSRKRDETSRSRNWCEGGSGNADGRVL